MASAKTGAGQTVLVTGGSGGIGLALASASRRTATISFSPPAVPTR